MFTLKIDEELELQLFQLQHAEELFRLIDTNRHYLRRWLPWIDAMNSAVQYQSIIPRWLEQFANNNGLNAGIRYKGHLVGCISFHQMDWTNRATSIGYLLAENFQGKGITTRAVQALVNYAFFELKLNRIEIRCNVGNIKSRSIPERLGFTQEGVVRQGELLNGQYHDLIVYSLLAHEWGTMN